MMYFTDEERTKATFTKLKKHPSKSASYVLRQIFTTMADREIMIKTVAGKIAQSANSMSGWRRGITLPTILSVEEMAAALGFRLELVEGTRVEEQYNGVLTEEERRVMAALVEAWNAFLALPVQHADDVDEFRHGIHRLQEKVFSRPAIKMENKRGRGL